MTSDNSPEAIKLLKLIAGRKRKEECDEDDDADKCDVTETEEKAAVRSGGKRSKGGKAKVPKQDPTKLTGVVDPKKVTDATES